MMTPIVIILIIAGIAKAIRDRLETGRDNCFPKTGTFWNKGTGNKFLGLHFDMWHLMDFTYINCLCFSCAIAYQIIPYGVALNALLYFIITQTIFNIFYSLFK